MVSYRRVKEKTLETFARNKAIAGISVLSLLFIYLVSINAINVTGISNDSVCAGTTDDPCIGYVNFTANTDVFIYPMDLERTFGTNVSLEDAKLYRSWGSGWREIDTDNGCTGSWCGCYWCTKSNTAEFSYAFRKGRSYELKIVALKDNPFDDVKWGFGPVDPVWYGVDYMVDGNTVYVNDSNAYISAMPHTIHSSGNVEFKMIPKTYNGEIDLIIGVNSSELKPSKALYHDPHYEYEMKSLRCAPPYWYNYTLDPRHLWCWENYMEYDNGTHINTTKTRLI